MSAVGCVPGGVCLGGICLGGVHHPRTEFLTHACENITFPQLMLWTVDTLRLSRKAKDCFPRNLRVHFNARPLGEKHLEKRFPWQTAAVLNGYSFLVTGNNNFILNFVQWNLFQELALNDHYTILLKPYSSHHTLLEVRNTTKAKQYFKQSVKRPISYNMIFATF